LRRVFCVSVGSAVIGKNNRVVYLQLRHAGENLSKKERRNLC
jgi:hypothetical protein